MKDMHEDLYWLAMNVSEWGASSEEYDRIMRYHGREDYCQELGCDFDGIFNGVQSFPKEEWLQARKDLGLIMSDEEEEIDAPEWAASVPDGVLTHDDTIKTSIKQLRYMDAKGEDWIDEFARTASVDEFRGAMKFTIGKYNRRAGKKDELIKEIEKMRDYCDRWIKYERSL